MQKQMSSPPSPWLPKTSNREKGKYTEYQAIQKNYHQERKRAMSLLQMVPPRKNKKKSEQESENNKNDRGNKKTLNQSASNSNKIYR